MPKPKGEKKERTGEPKTRGPSTRALDERLKKIEKEHDEIITFLGIRNFSPLNASFSPASSTITSKSTLLHSAIIPTDNSYCDNMMQAPNSPSKRALSFAAQQQPPSKLASHGTANRRLLHADSALQPQARYSPQAAFGQSSSQPLSYTDAGNTGGQSNSFIPPQQNYQPAALQGNPYFVFQGVESRPSPAAPTMSDQQAPATNGGTANHEPVSPAGSRNATQDEAFVNSLIGIGTNPIPDRRVVSDPTPYKLQKQVILYLNNNMNHWNIPKETAEGICYGLLQAMKVFNLGRVMCRLVANAMDGDDE